MAELGVKGTDLEVYLLFCVLDVNIVVHQNFGPGRAWQCFGPGLIIVHNYALYLYNTRALDHYDCVIPVVQKTTCVLSLPKSCSVQVCKEWLVL